MCTIALPFHAFEVSCLDDIVVYIDNQSLSGFFHAGSPGLPGRDDETASVTIVIINNII